MSKMPSDLSDEEQKRILDTFVEMCRLGVELGLDNASMAGILSAYARMLLEDDRPMQYYIDRPLGNASGLVT